MREDFLKLLNKVINNEMEAVIFYKRAANNIPGIESKQVNDDLLQHANEEYVHFKRLIKYCSHYNLNDSISINLNPEITNFKITNLKAVMTKIQALEIEAQHDYKTLFKMSTALEDAEGMKLFAKHLEKEIQHYNDLSYVLGDSLSLFPVSGEGIMTQQEHKDDLVENILAENESIQVSNAIKALNKKRN